MSKLCMLAHPYEEDKHKELVEGWFISEKYDGVRGLWDGEHMKSRNGNIYTMPDNITEQFKKIGMKLDGEIWFGKDTFALCSGAARKSTNDPDVWKLMNYQVFDTPDFDLPFEERIKIITKALDRDDIPNIKKVVFKKFNPKKTTIAEELKNVEEAGGEGLMLRKPGSMYVNTRSHDMLKVKNWIYQEAIVLEYIQGTGRLKGLVGSLLVKSNEFSEDGTYVVFRVGSGLTDWQRFSGMDKNSDVPWKKYQTTIDDARKEHANNEDHSNESEYIRLVQIIKTEKGKNRNDALHLLNKTYLSVPLLSDTITFRYKETTGDGNPSFPTFIGIRDYE